MTYNTSQKLLLFKKFSKIHPKKRFVYVNEFTQRADNVDHLMIPICSLVWQYSLGLHSQTMRGSIVLKVRNWECLKCGKVLIKYKAFVGTKENWYSHVMPKNVYSSLVELI